MAGNKIVESASNNPKVRSTASTTDAAKNLVDESDYTSSSGSSSDEEIYEDDQDAKIQASFGHASTSKTRTVPVKPESSGELKSRLTAFLPQIERSNRELEASGDAEARRIDKVDENDQHYVEMNLGLGVLVEKQPGDEDVRYRDDSDDELSLPGERHDDSERNEQDAPTTQRDMTDRPAPKRKNKIEEL